MRKSYLCSPAASIEAVLWRGKSLRWTIGERTRPACSFGRRARTIVGQISLTGFRRDAENGNRDGRAPFLDGFCFGRWVAVRQLPDSLGLAHFRLSRWDERRCQMQFGLDVWSFWRLNFQMKVFFDIPIYRVTRGKYESEQRSFIQREMSADGDRNVQEMYRRNPAHKKFYEKPLLGNIWRMLAI